MKRLLLAFAMAALFAPVMPVKGAEVSVNFFYDNLSGGSWIETGDYGYAWQPDVVVSNGNWRPYTDGYWAYTDHGWTWVSYEDFGWATYHYGRWARLSDYGWVWVPGYEWGPAWVSWRVGSEQVGWAPLPPSEVVYEGRPITGHVDITFDIGPSHYNFVDVHYIGEPVLLGHIYEPSRNTVYINNSVNVTNITVKNKTVYNYGPDVEALSKVSKNRIQRLKLEKQALAADNKQLQAGMLTKVQGNKLVVAAPDKIQKSAQPVAPPKVKAKVAKGKIDKGWGADDPKATADLKTKMQSEDSKKVPQLKAKADAGAKADLTGGGAGAAATADLDGVKAGKKAGKAVKAEAADAGAPPAPTDANAAAGGTKAGEGKKGKGAKLEAADAGAPPTGDTSASATAGGPGMTAGEGAKGMKGKKHQMEAGPKAKGAAKAEADLAPVGPAGAEADMTAGAKGKRQQKLQNQGPDQPGFGEGKKHKKLERLNAGEAGEAGPGGPPRGRKLEGAGGPRPGIGQGDGGRAQPKGEGQEEAGAKGKKKKKPGEPEDR